MSKQRKQTTGRNIVADYYEWPRDCWDTEGVFITSSVVDLARRIDRAIAAAVRKAKLQWERESAMIHAQNSGAGRRVNAGSGS